MWLFTQHKIAHSFKLWYKNSWTKYRIIRIFREDPIISEALQLAKIMYR